MQTTYHSFQFFITCTSLVLGGTFLSGCASEDIPNEAYVGEETTLLESPVVRGDVEYIEGSVKDLDEPASSGTNELLSGGTDIGCSNAQIRRVQGLCRAEYGNRSRGVHACADLGGTLLYWCAVRD
jgi:hypothetical protein